MVIAVTFPAIDPVALQIGPLAIRWYALAYLAGLAGGAVLAVRLLRRERLWSGGVPPLTAGQVWDLVGWVALGLLAGGRLGFVLFYQPLHYLHDPLAILAIWRGGMSFHGGLVGAVVAMWWFARTRSVAFLSVADLVACLAPLGILFGRVANFINGELWGRVSDVPWAMVFPAADDSPRHPSQLYEAVLEGLLLLLLLNGLAYLAGALRRPGLIAGAFALGYALARGIGEQFRQPDAALGFLLPFGAGGVTMGMLLSVPLAVLGVGLLLRAGRGPASG